MTNDVKPLYYLPWLRTFEAAARRENFTLAARDLGLTQAAVSQHLQLLESALGEKLFERKRRGVTLTAAGAAFLPHVQSAFGSIQRSAGELFGEKANIRITVRSPISFAVLWLSPRLPGLARELPHISLEVKTIQLPADYGEEPGDFDIRFGSGSFAGREALRLTSQRLVPAVAPALLNGSDPADALKRLPLLGVAGAREMWRAWFESAKLPYAAPPLFRFDSFIAALAAAEAGAGVLLASRPLVDRYLEDGRLVTLSSHELAGDQGHFLTWRAGRVLDHAATELLAWIGAQ